MDMGKWYMGDLYKMNKWNKFVQGPQKLNDGSVKMIHLGMIDQGFTVVVVLDFQVLIAPNK
jgi:hypothetical protein